MTKYEPQGSRIIVQRDESSKKIGSIHVPESVTDAMSDVRHGTILAAGPGRYEYGTFVENRLKAGQRVVFPANYGAKLEEGVYVLEAAEVLAVVREEK